MTNHRHIRQAAKQDACRIVEIEIFNYRMYFYPLFQNDAFYFDQLQTASVMETYLLDDSFLRDTYVYDDGVVKGFIRVSGSEIEKLFVEPVLQGQSIGAYLLEYAVKVKHASFLWALEKNKRAIRFYERHGFHVTTMKKLEDDTTEYLIRLER